MGSQIKELLTKMYAISFLLSHDDANGFYGYFYYPNWNKHQVFSILDILHLSEICFTFSSI